MLENEEENSTSDNEKSAQDDEIWKKVGSREELPYKLQPA